MESFEAIAEICLARMEELEGFEESQEYQELKLIVATCKVLK